MRSPDALRIAIVGCGPKGLYALESLCRIAAKRPHIRFRVAVFEPAAAAGAGGIYAPDQPHYLVMNFPVCRIDASPPDCAASGIPDLLTWLTGHHPRHAEPHAYVPRAIVGEYLAWVFGTVRRDAPPNVSMTVRRETVTRLDRTNTGWVLGTATDRRCRFDEVLIATGHQDWRRQGGHPDPAIDIASPFPPHEKLDLRRVPPGSVVHCKGYALTFLDAMLALTEGRGGVFAPDGLDWRYRASGNEPKVIRPHSRTGRPMRAKLEHRLAVPSCPQGFWDHARLMFSNRSDRNRTASFGADVWPWMLGIADRAIGAPSGAADAFFAERCSTVFDAPRSFDDLKLGHDIAMGRAGPDIGWAIGECWRRLYPNLVGWVSHRSLDAPDARLFRQVAAEMERLAFGPPAGSVGKLICLIDRGLVDLSDIAQPAGPGVCIDATIPPPGAAALAEPLRGLLANRLVERGILGGLMVDETAAALVDGRPVGGLSIIGRATEGCVLGNDTLSRHLHDLPERWAGRVVGRAAATPGLQTELT